MSVITTKSIPDPTENWDDDFEFQSSRGSNTHTRRSTLTEDWTEPSSPLFKDKKNTLSNASTSLQHWAEPGPSTPSKRTHAIETENWDDDYQDGADSPLRRHATGSSPRSRRSRRRPSMPGPENWDDDFEEGNPASSAGKGTHWDSSSSSDEELGFADREDDRTVTSRSRRAALPRVLPNETPPPPVPPIPSLFMSSHMDPAPFPRSPTASVFSVPVSGRESIAAYSYSSRTHLALRPTLSGSSLGALPPSPPIHHARERRRLRKKSRPPRVEDNIYEMDDRIEVPLRPATPDQLQPTLAASGTPPSDVQPESTPMSAGKSSLVSRIGSVGKKWGASRKKRASTGPSEVMAQERERSTQPRPQSMAIPSPPSTSSKTGWFFRHGGAPGSASGSPPSQQSAMPLRHEKSVDRILSFVGIEQDTPSKRRRQKNGISDDKRRESGSGATDGGCSGESDSPAVFLFGEPRRPTSMQVSSSRAQSRPHASRHASYGQARGRETSSSRSSSAARSASASVEELSSKRRDRKMSVKQTHEAQGRSSLDHESGSRSFTSGLRRISLAGKHKRSQSNIAGQTPDRGESGRPSTSTTDTAIPIFPLDRTDDATPRPQSRIKSRPSVDRALLPPIELQPPSPPQTCGPSGLSLSYSEPIPESSALGIDSLLIGHTTPTSTLHSSQTLPLVSSHNLLDTLAVSPSPSPTRMKPSTSPQAASLGRSTHPPKDREQSTVTPPRRNSLGDLKIPARISQAQVGLRRDLGMVREFASSVDQLKDLQFTYSTLVSEVLALLVEIMPPEQIKPRAVSPTFFGFPRPVSRARSNTNPQLLISDRAIRHGLNHQQLTVSFRTIESKYRLSWECAELLIEIGGGGPSQGNESSGSPASPSSTLNPIQYDARKSRERAITLAGDEQKPQLDMQSPHSAASFPSSHWRASTGRHDLSQRQLLLLRDMLGSPDGSIAISSERDIPEEDVNRNWKWGDAMSSTVTLPSEESSHPGSNSGAGGISPIRKRKSGRLGMRGLRDMLRSLKKNYSDSQDSAHNPALPAVPDSSTAISISTDSSLNLPVEQRSQSVVQRRRAKTSVGPDSIKSWREPHPNSPYVTSTSLHHRPSPRRPSLASIFRLGQKSKSSTAKSSPQAGPGIELPLESVQRIGSNSSSHVGSDVPPDEEDWDRVESSSDLEGLSHSKVDVSATLKGGRGRSPYAQQQGGVLGTPKRSANASRSSIWGAGDVPQLSSHSESFQSPGIPEALHHYLRANKLSNVQENAEQGECIRRSGPRRSLSKGKRRASGAPSPNPKRPPSRDNRAITSDSVRSVPAQLRQDPSQTLDHDASHDDRFTVAMTPENIKPLLENAKEVHVRCTDCIEELRQLLSARP